MCIKKLKIKVEIIIKNISKFIMWVFNKIFGDFFNNLKRIYKIIIKRIKKIIDDKIEYEYESLNPDNTIDRKSFDALEYTFLNKNITNIAITGNYSSGKSSIIESFIDKNFCFKKKFFILSLATLSDDNKKYDAKEIEKSIIEQLYYSNLIKIVDIEKNFFKCLSAICSIFLFDIIYIFLLSKLNLIMQIDTYIRFWLYVIFIIIMSLFMYKVLKIIQRSNKVSITAPNIEIDIKGEEGDSNIINKELGLIQSIINTIGIKYIIFEDLDRFNKSIIFEHLRELNIILNNQKKIFNNSKIKFIYLIRDEVFKDENRTKFFDFIYPVIPYVTYNTSGEELNKVIKKYNLQEELPERDILNICSYINDFRILKNVLNEYRIYKNDLNRKNINSLVLFSILLYKNTFSEDFSKLQQGEGNLYNVLEDIKKVKEELINDNKKEIIKLEDEIEHIQRFKIENMKIKEAIWNTIGNELNSFDNVINLRNKSNVYNAREYKFKDIKYIIPLDFLINDDTIISYFNSQNKVEKNNLKKVLSKNKDTTALINEYKKNIVENQAEIKRYNSDIEKDQSYIEYYKEMNVKLKEGNNKEIFSKIEWKKKIFKEFNGNSKKEELVKYLIRNDYINNNYEIYINQFHPGSLSKNDEEYIMSFKINGVTDYKCKIDNPDKVIEKIIKQSLGNKALFNVYLLKELINKKDVVRINEICNLFYKYDKIIEFFSYIIENYLEEEQDFFFEIYVKNKSFWENFSNKSDKYIQDISKILEKLLLKLDKENICNIDNYENLCKFIKTNDLLINDYKYIEIVKSLDIKYNNLGLERFDLNMRKSCIENDCFEINYENLKYIFIVYYGLSITNFESKNFSSICNHKIEKYIKENINVYIDQVYLKLKGNYRNEEKDVIYLLNNSKINQRKKEIIIERENIKFKNIKLIQNKKIQAIAFQKNKVINSWYNIIAYFNNKKKIDNVLINFINNNIELIKKKSSFHQCNSKDIFCKEISKCYNIKNVIYDFVSRNSDIKVKLNEINEIPRDKLEILIRTGKLDINIEEYREFSNNDSDIFILYTKYNTTIIEKRFLSNYLYSINEVNLILKKDSIGREFKHNLLSDSNNFSTTDLNQKSALEFVKYIEKNELSVKLRVDDIKKFLECMPEKKRINLLKCCSSKISTEDFSDIILTYLTRYDALVKNESKVYGYGKKVEDLIQLLKLAGFEINYNIKDGKIYVNS